MLASYRALRLYCSDKGREARPEYREAEGVDGLCLSAIQHLPLPLFLAPTHLSSSAASSSALAVANLLGLALDLFGEGPGTEGQG